MKDTCQETYTNNTFLLSLSNGVRYLNNRKLTVAGARKVSQSRIQMDGKFFEFAQLYLNEYFAFTAT